ncbi:uncharacterized protein [Drosophila takahashii]|uniref:uncharacterized protein n=1 Tax=Drosophila takahashii TaxID=29030 RepID=UPI001CF8535F|nr:uncharacterized protein LOC108055674 [Drosophila takahashii]
MQGFKLFVLLVLLHQFNLSTNGYSHQHPGFAQRLQIKPLCLQVPQRYTEAPTPTPTIIFSALEKEEVIRAAKAD